jgi:hypothetical protein
MAQREVSTHINHITMKKICLMAVLAIVMLGASAQKVTKDKNGNLVPIGQVTSKDTTDTKVNVYVDKKGTKHDVYRGPKGGLYYWGTDKHGKKIKRYLQVQ